MTHLLVIALGAVVLAAAPGLSHAARSEQAEALGCVIRPSKVIDVGSPTVGVINTLDVDRGDTVTSGQVIATLRGDVERAAVAVAASRADAEAELAAATRALEAAQRKLDRAQELHGQQFISEQAVELAVAERDAARARRAQADEQAKLARRELQLAVAQLGQRTIRSPIDGVIVEVFRQVGERVEERPIVKVAKLDPLHAEVVLPASQFGVLRAGQQIQVQPSMSGFGPVTGVVRVVDSVIDAASGTLRARVVLPNPGATIPAGVRCTVTLPPPPTTIGAER